MIMCCRSFLMARCLEREIGEEEEKEMEEEEEEEDG
jgi:hypothetical protein